MSQREQILGRIREALSVPSPARGHAADPTKSGAAISNWLPLVGETFTQRVELFRLNAAELRAEFKLVADTAGLTRELTSLRDADGWRKVATHSGALTTISCAALGLPIVETDNGYDPRDLESCDAGITECDALIAQTGTVLVTSRSAGGRALSALPPHHVVLARREQLLPDLPTAFEFLQAKYAAEFPSFISLITGPSRTGDIERILVLGAHGPRKLTILCF